MKFKANRSGLIFYLKYWIIAFTILMLLPIIFHLIFDRYTEKIYSQKDFLLISSGLAPLLISLFTKKHIYEIDFDYNKEEVSFFFKKLLFLRKQRNVSFTNVDVTLIQTRRKLKPMALWIYEKNKEILQITRDKDGFSIEQLNEIFATIEKL